jgi:methyl-accepting chemotaxis protein
MIRILGRLHFKVALAVVGVVGLVMGSMVWLNLKSQHDNQLANLTISALQLCEATYSGLRKPMAVGDNGSVQAQLGTSAGGEGVRMQILDPDLQVVFASQQAEVGRPLTDFVGDPELLGSVDAALKSGDGSVKVFEETGNKDFALAVLRPIRNEEDCHHCHGASRKVLGGLFISHSTTELQRQLSTLRRTNLLGSVLGGLVILGLVVWLLSRMVLEPIREMGRAAEAVARGDLSYRMDRAKAAPATTDLLDRVRAAWADDEIAQLGNSISSMTEGVRAMVLAMVDSARELERHSNVVLSTAAQQSAMAAQQAAAISETTATMAEIAQTSKEASSHADDVIAVAGRSEELSRDGQRVVTETIDGMEKLAAQVHAIAESVAQVSQQALQIGNIITTVKDLAEQSNLLALNAAIESAKAGEAGRGFAVLAREMRALAEQSKSATTQVRAILQEIQKGMRAAVGVSHEGTESARVAIGMAHGAGESITGLAQTIRDSSAAARQIAANTRQQTVGIDQIVLGIAELQAAMQDVHEGTRTIETVAGELAKVARNLGTLVGRYNT